MKFLRNLAYLAILFFMVAARAANVEQIAQSVTCGGLTWTDGEVLGQHNSKNVVTVIHEGRIYIKYQGESTIISNRAILFHMSNNRFPADQYIPIIDGCVNAQDPSTDANGYLGPVVNGTISCNGDVYTDGLWLGDYVGGDNVITKQYAIIEDGLLRINYHRQGTPYQRKDISSDLIKQTIDGENGSYMNPNLGFQITKAEIDGCFWNTLPIYPDGGAPTTPTTPEPSDGNCQSGPTLVNTSNVSATGLTFQFDAINVSNIKWQVKTASGSVAASGETGTLTSANVPISFGTTLASGQYTLEIQGASCVSNVSSRTFSVSLPACTSTPVIGNILNVSTTSLVFNYTSAAMNNVQWEIRSGSNVVANGVAATSQATATLRYADLAPGNYTLAIKSADCTGNFVTKAFTIPVPPLSPCQSGPTLVSTSNVSATGMTFQFDALGVSQIKWAVKSGTTVVASGTTPQLTSAVVNIAFGKTLAAGTYTLEIQGASCTSSASTRTFSVALANCTSTPTIGTISDIATTALKFTYTGTANSKLQWEIRNGATVVASNTTTASGNTATINYSALAPGTYTLAVKTADCTGSFNTKSFTIPVPPLANCTEGPSIVATSNVSATGLTFQFHANNVSQIKWEVKSNGTVVASGTTPQLTSALVDITFGKTLAAGTYQLEIQGGNCTSAVSSQAFSVAEANCAIVPTIGTISSISTTGLTFNYTGAGVTKIEWEVREGSTVVARNITGVLPSTSATITYGTLPAGNYTLAIKAANCESAFNTKTFFVPLTESRTPCNYGPNLMEVYDITSSGLQFNFHGDGVYQLDWKILQNGNVVRQDRLSPTSDRPTIAYEQLPDGQYTLEIQGGSCISTPSSMAFALNVPLYIYITQFEATQSKAGVTLNWNVVEEKNGEKFEVIRYDASMRNPEVIGTVYLRDNTLGKYDFLDENPSSGANYYQLKMIDRDGSFSESKLIAVNYNQIFDAVIAPNPAHDEVTLSFVSKEAGLGTIQVYNLMGQQVGEYPLAVSVGANRQKISVNYLVDGHYFVKVVTATQQINLRLVKVN